MGKLEGIKEGSRLRLAAAHYPRGYAFATVERTNGGIANIKFDGGGEALLYEPLGHARTVSLGERGSRLIESFEVVAVTDACDPDDEPTFGEVA